ncbi:choline transporter-like 1 isoform X2 [Neodiprion pinetum]|uniref:Choline transporter-like protein n=1 Tax=Neodiprion lecontei TaxID=441921 RepID=A0A6J0BCB0_NEOLC|nr:choline transporter-like 1 isoform X2 [Neodiprion lecontei]XP_046421222.1 choline transporter-like 1 isoform X2 [Neodiprion fabricii]XP_046477730.1 choline transporter-like 1 isoform X2 [Neodiprion pinetum]XP_046615024.1 choline transporter-like 1 isoform X2 [Neodiprion virginianus]
MSCCCGDDEDERPEPTRVRGCTDIFWLCLFILFWFLMILIAAFALVYGNPIRLINGFDSFDNTCGVKNNKKFGNMELSGQDTSDKPYLFFLDVANLKDSLKICVKECPDRNMETMEQVCQFYKDTGSQLCHDRPGSKFSACTSQNSKDKTGACPVLPVYNSTVILNRCIPRAIGKVAETIASNVYGLINSWDAIEQILGDLYKTWREIVALSFLAFVLSLFMIAIFHLLASIVSWIVMILVTVSCIGGTGLLWWTYIRIKIRLDETNPNELLEESVRNGKAFLIYSIVATILTIILLFLLCFLRHRISIMAQLFKESAKCLAELPGLFFQPLLTFLSLLVFFAFWITIVLCLATANYPGIKKVPMLMKDQVTDEVTLTTSSGRNDSINYKTFTLVEYVDSTWVKYMWWVYIIGLIWISEFIIACQNMVIAGAVAHWYFRGKDASLSPVCSSMGKLVSYHLGSVACGSLLITIFKVPRLILTYLHAKFEKTKETSPCAQCGLKCCICCFYCLEKFIRYMNHNAYTVIAIEGTHFCNAARIAFTTLVSNALQIAVINGIGDFILFLGKCFVTAATGSVGLLFLRQDPTLHFYAAPIFVICVFAFFIAHSVISLYETVIDTLFLCICEDKNLHGENGKWRQSALANVGSANPSTNGQQSLELSPINQ